MFFQFLLLSMGFIIDCCSNVSFSLLFWVMRRTNSRNPSTKWIRVQVLAQRTFQSIVQNGKIHPKTWAPINFCTVLEISIISGLIHSHMDEGCGQPLRNEVSFSYAGRPEHQAVGRVVFSIQQWFLQFTSEYDTTWDIWAVIETFGWLF